MSNFCMMTKFGEYEKLSPETIDLVNISSKKSPVLIHRLQKLKKIIFKNIKRVSKFSVLFNVYDVYDFSAFFALKRRLFWQNG